MEWNHLPSPGGLYDQHPEMLERFSYIFAAQAEEERKREAQEKAKRSNTMRRPSMGQGRRR